MTQWCLKSNGQVIPRRMVKRLTAEQLAPSNAVDIAKRAASDADIKRRLGDSFSLPVNKQRMKTRYKEDSLDDYYGPTPFLDLYAEDPSTITEAGCVDVNGKPILLSGELKIGRASCSVSMLRNSHPPMQLKLQREQFLMPMSSED